MDAKSQTLVSRLFHLLLGILFLIVPFRYLHAKENIICLENVEAKNSNGVQQSKVLNSTSNNTNNDRLTKNLQLNFSCGRGIFDEPFRLKITSNYPEASIVYTTDCSIPSAENGVIYTDLITIDSTTIIKAVALWSNSTSAVITESYIFESFAEKQGKTPRGFPETWGGKTVIEADYEMDSEIIKSPNYQSEISGAIESIPSLSLTMNVDDWFNHKTGLYVGYPNSSETREKAVTAEFLFQDKENFAVECGVQNQGGTSFVNWKIPKQSMRLLFKKIYGPSRLKYKLFPDSDINSINTLVIDGLLYSWVHPWDDKQRVTSLYFRDQLTSDLQNEMGGLSFHGVYVHLFINGLYWGVYDLHERPDDAFLSEYLDADREDFNIIKHNPNNIMAGSNQSYLRLLEQARNGFSTAQEVDKIENYLDLPAFIDYMILNFYLGNYDWAHQNYYAAQNKKLNTGFRFYTWDAEHVMRYSNVLYNNTAKNDVGGPTEIHTLLKANAEYRMMFADAVYKHLFNDGALTPENFEKKFLFRKNEIAQAIILESARWGDYRKSISGVTYSRDEFWQPEVDKVLEEYIPQRRDIVISQFRDPTNKLFPQYMPPVFEVKEQPSKGGKTVKLLNVNTLNGTIYFTIDGSDPRRVGGAIRGTKYIDPISLGKSSIVKARFYSTNNKSWSALAEKTFLMDDVLDGSIVINEIMYHPADGLPEFIELINSGETAINLREFSFTDGIDFLFKKSKIVQPAAGLVLTNDTILFEKTYKYKAWKQYNKKLNNGGETIILKNGLNQIVDSVTYSDTIPWPEMADGDGYSLELIDPNLDNALVSSWRISDEVKGSPFRTYKKLDLVAEIYPNPFTDVVKVIVDNEGLANEIFTIDIFNQLGSKVKSIESKSINSIIEFNLSTVLPGIYFIRIVSENDSQFNEVVVKAVKMK